MPRKQAGKKATRQRFISEFKQQALARAAKEGVSSAARDVGLEPVQLYAWRGNARQQGQGLEEQRLMESELARLRRELARSEEEVAF